MYDTAILLDCIAPDMKKGLIAVCFASILIAVALFYPYFLHLTNSLPNSVDPVFYAWNLAYNAHSVFKGFSAMLNTNIFYPLTNTIAFSDTLWAQSIVTNPIIWLTKNPVLAENIAIFISFPLSAIAMFLLSYYVTKNSEASFLAGLFYAFSYPRLAQIGHLPTISNEWLPLYVLYLLKFLDVGKHKNLLLLILWFFLSIASSIYFGVFLIPVTAVIIIFDIVKKIQRNTIQEYLDRLKILGIWIIPFCIVLSIIVFPYIRLKIENPGIKRSIDDLTFLRALPSDYLTVLPTTVLTATHLRKNTNEHVLFPTFTVLALAMFGVYKAWKKQRFLVTTFCVLAVTSLILSLGNEHATHIATFSTSVIRLPYYYIYTYVPIFQIVRVPARLGIFVILSLVLLASIGITAIIGTHKKTRIMTVVILIFFLVEIWQSGIPYVTVPLSPSFPKVYQWIKNYNDRMVLAELPVKLFFGMSMEQQLYKPFNSLSQTDNYILETYRLYFSTMHQKTMINGYSGYLPDSYNRLTANLENFPTGNTIQTLSDIGVTHVVVHVWEYAEDKQSVIRSELNTSPKLKLTYADDNDLVYSIIKQ